MLTLQNKWSWQSHKPLLNGLLFQLNWFICIFYSDLAIAGTCVLIVLHQRYFVESHKEWYIITFFSTIGFIVDFSWSLFGLVTFTTFPIWLFCLWISFACCLNHALLVFHQRLPFLLVLTTVSIPINYYLGAKYTHTQFSEPVWLPLLFITLFWIVLLRVFIPLLRKEH